VTAFQDDRILTLVRMPVMRTPTPVARNVVVKEARKHNCDFLFMIDDDMGVPESFFPFALDFLIKHQGPAAIAVPYCTAPPIESVTCFEWASGESHTEGYLIGLECITREDACRRKGVERMANVGTGCIAYSMGCFDKIEEPYYDYGYVDKSRTAVNETDDCYCHRKLWQAKIPLYVSWDHWADHYKEKRVRKPTRIDVNGFDGVYIKHALAQLVTEKRNKLVELAQEEASKNGNGMTAHETLAMLEEAQQKLREFTKETLVEMD
jgi:hypothetical protein